MDPEDLHYESVKGEWIDQYVEVISDQPELKRFAGLVGRVITVNYNLKSLVDFGDGAWYDITASSVYLKKLDPATAKAKYKGDANSAQPFPAKQG